MFEEAGRIGPSLEALVEGGVCGADLELLLVDDGSSDGTAEVAEATLARLGVARSRVLRLGVNRGKGAAVRAGMLAADGAVRAFVDADLCVDAEDIERCFALLEGPADVVYGTRAHPESSLEANQPAYRVLSGRTFNLLLRLLSLTDERDTQCGLKGATAAAVGEVFEPLVTERFAFDVEVLARAARSGLRVEPLAVSWSHVPASRVRPVRDGLDMARAAVRIRRILAREARRAGDGAPGTVSEAGTASGPGTTSGVGADRDAAGPAMAPEAIEAMARVEREHWWFRAKHQLVLDALDRHEVTGRVVDVGAGTGGLLEHLAAAGRPAVGAELDPLALSLARQGTPSPALVRAVAEAVPVASGAAGAVTCLDVVEHLDDDVAGLRELARVAGPGGLVVVMVPAHQWAWSEHDVRLGHRRRYERPALRSAATAAGLDVLRCTHVHSWLVPPALVLRRTPLGRLLRGSAEEASMGSPAVNRILAALTRLERRWTDRRDLPAGLSILLVARVPGVLGGG